MSNTIIEQIQNIFTNLLGEDINVTHNTNDDAYLVKLSFKLDWAICGEIEFALDLTRNILTYRYDDINDTYYVYPLKLENIGTRREKLEN